MNCFQKIKESMKKQSNLYALWKEYYFVIIPIAITILLYFSSLFYGFRNFDEDNVIKKFFLNKTFNEYLGKYIYLDLYGITQAQGFTFSGIKNVHFCILERPLFYLVNFLFHARPFLFHLLGLLLHCAAIYYFTKFSYELCKNKQISLFSGLIWAIHPTNVEPVIWATNWPALLGIVIYFYTLYKAASLVNKGASLRITTIFTVLMTAIQILLIEHTISIPFAILLTIYYQLKTSFNKPKAFQKALMVSFPSFVVILAYWILRINLIAKVIGSNAHDNLTQSLERIIFLTPQVFFHQIKLIFFPLKLSIDQIDLLTLDKVFLGSYNLFCIFFLILFLLLILLTKNKFPLLSFGLLLGLITVSPFIQIIPLYSLSGERYNYLASAFMVFGIISSLLNFRVKKLFVIFLILISILLGARTISRISNWKNSTSLFSSTIKTSQSLFKRGIWTYNLAICQEDENTKIRFLKESTKILKKFVQQSSPYISEPAILKTYELDQKSLYTKAFIRIATNYEILKDQNLQLKHLLKALKISGPGSQVRSLVYKNLGTFYFQMNDFNKTVSYYQKSNIIFPSPTIDFAIAVCYLRLKDFTNYEKYLKKAISKTSSDGEAFKTYGQLLDVSKGDYQGAVKYYKIATVLQNSPEPYILLTTAYLKLRDIDNAFKTTKNGLYGFPEDPTLLYLHSTILINKKNLETGLRGLTKVAKNANAPGDIRAESCNILVNIFLKQNNLPEAKKYNDLVLTIDPKNQEALKNKTFLNMRI